FRANPEADGYETGLASDGQTALSRILDEQPDVVILDVMMPLMDGWQVLQALPRGHSHVIVLSAKANERDVARALSLGASAYVTKPYDPEELSAVVANVLAGPNDPLASRRTH